MTTHKRLSTIDPDSPMMTPIDESNGGIYNLSQIGLEEEGDENMASSQSGSDGRFAAARIRVDDGTAAGQYDGATGERIGEGRYRKWWNNELSCWCALFDVLRSVRYALFVTLCLLRNVCYYCCLL